MGNAYRDSSLNSIPLFHSQLGADVWMYICIPLYTYIYTYIESEGGFHRAELLQFSLHQAGPVATHRRHCLCLPVRGEQLGNARLLTPVQRNKQINKSQTINTKHLNHHRSENWKMGN